MKRTVSRVSGKRIFAFFGEAGSGKSENALNWAIRLSSQTESPIHFFDLDQTKFIYRAQDFGDRLTARGITVHASPKHLDSPMIAPGVTGALMDRSCVCILDIGGGSSGATIAAQFAEYLTGQDSRIFYVLNPYRPFLETGERVRASIASLLSIAGLRQAEVIANPCMGERTTLADVESGLLRCGELLRGSGLEPELVSVEAALASELRERTELEILPLDLCVRYD